jgi:hypothetical protein
MKSSLNSMRNRLCLLLCRDRETSVPEDQSISAHLRLAEFNGGAVIRLAVLIRAAQLINRMR